MNGNIMALISLLVLIGAIAFGFARKVNVGILSIGLALVVGKLIGMSDKEIYGGWGTKLFMILLGTTFLFGILQANGTLDLLARKIVAAAGRQARMIPWALFVMGAVIAAVGPGVVPSFAMVAMFAVPLAKAMGLDLNHTLCLTTVGQFGSLAGSLTPLAASGIIATNLSTDIGVEGLALPMNISIITVSLIGGIVSYFALGGHKIKGENPYKLSDLPKFDKKQLLSLSGIIAMVVIVLITQYHIGLVAFAIAVLLIICGVGRDKEALKFVPWNTLILVSGVGVLMNVVINAGGIVLLTNAISSIMSPGTALGIFACICGCMSWFSSTSGVVMPTMIPTIPGIIANIGAAN
ncbi:MAG: SLC13 family permease, partial [Oscillospiraceae bacterium]